MKRITVILAGLILPAISIAADYDFDIGAYEKKAWQINGYLSYSAEYQSLNTDAALYTLAYGTSGLETNQRQLAQAELRGQYKWDDSGLYLTLQADNQTDKRQSFSSHRSLEAYYAQQASSRLRYELGKRTLKWGKGYAWNPLGFVERDKDPLDPEQSREGYTLANVDYINSINLENLRTFGVTAIFLPVDSQYNTDFNAKDDWLAIKLYLLYLNNDIDFVFMDGAQHQPR